MTWNFDYDNRYYAIPFRNRAIQISGESGTGKTLMCQDLQRCLSINAQMKKEVLLINNQNSHLINLDKMNSFKYIVVDNADIVLTPEIERLIINSQLKGEMYWILLGRDSLGCIASNSIGILTHEEKEGKYIFSVDFSQR